TTTMHLAAAAQTRSTAALSAAESCMSLTGRGTLWSPGSNAHRGPPTSPKPSEYGVSPTTTTPVASGGTGVEASALNVVVPPPLASRIPSRMVWPGITLVDPPCQVSVQPPAWLPMLSAFEPAT